MKIEKNTREIEPIERIAMLLKIKRDEPNLILKVQDKINLKDKLIKKLKFENIMLKNELSKAQCKKEVTYKNANYQELEKKYIKEKELNAELGLALEGLRREVRMYKNERINNIIEKTNVSKELRELLV